MFIPYITHFTKPFLSTSLSIELFRKPKSIGQLLLVSFIPFQPKFLLILKIKYKIIRMIIKCESDNSMNDSNNWKTFSSTGAPFSLQQCSEMKIILYKVYVLKI